MTISNKHLEDIKLSLADYPGLSLHEGSENPYIQGSWPVSFNGFLIDTYEIKIQIPNNYPHTLPLVYELSNKIPKKPGRHLNEPNWDACLFVADARWEIWPIDTSFKEFLQIPVHNFFLWQAYFDEFQEIPPWGERSHYDAGVIEYYYEKFRVTQPYQALQLLLATKYITKRTERCPCGKDESFGSCHYEIVKKFRDKADPVRLQKAIDIFMVKAKERNSELKEKRDSKLKKAFDTSPNDLLKT